MRRSRGFALAYFLLVTVLVLMFVTTLFFQSRQQLFVTQGVVNETRALYAAEAGVARITAELERNPTWMGSFSDEPLPSGTATFSASFTSSPTTSTSTECINNLSNDGAVDSYHGPLTVPGRSAMLVVTGKAGLVTRTVEVLIVLGADLPPEHALTATGKIFLEGDVEVNGISTLDDRTNTPAHLHSNSLESGTIIDYSGGDPDEEMVVSGRVTSSGSDASSIVLGGTSNVAGGTESQSPQRKLPRPNIEAMVGDQVGNPGPALTPVGTVTLTGDNYYSANQVINGDLVLENNARIFVEGNLNVNGSIRGNGAVVVNGNTELFGNSQILAGEENEYISLLSAGNVTMKGFDGEAFLDALVAGAPNPGEATKNLTDMRWAINEIRDYLSVTHANTEPAALDSIMNIQDDFLDARQTVISHHRNITTADNAGRERASVVYLTNLLLATPPGPTRDFMESRLLEINGLFRSDEKKQDNSEPSNRVNAEIIASYPVRDEFHDGGIFDALQSVPPPPPPPPGDPVVGPPSDATYQKQTQITGHLSRFDANRVGSAEFKGFVFTEGTLVVEGDLNVLGTVVVNENPNLPGATVGSTTYPPGDVVMTGSSRLIHVNSLFEEGVLNLEGAGTLDIKRWVNR